MKISQFVLVIRAELFRQTTEPSQKSQINSRTLQFAPSSICIHYNLYHLRLGFTTNLTQISVDPSDLEIVNYKTHSLSDVRLWKTQEFVQWYMVSFVYLRSCAPVIKALHTNKMRYVDESTNQDLVTLNVIFMGFHAQVQWKTVYIQKEFTLYHLDNKPNPLMYLQSVESYTRWNLLYLSRSRELGRWNLLYLQSLESYMKQQNIGADSSFSRVCLTGSRW